MMYAVMNAGARRLCQHKRILSTSSRISNLLNQDTNGSYHNIRHRSSFPFTTGLASTQNQPITVRYQSTLNNPDVIQPHVQDKIYRLSQAIEEHKTYLNNNGNVYLGQVSTAIKLMNEIIVAGHVDLLKEKLGSIPNHGEVLLASCGRNLIFVSPQKREQMAGEVWTCLSQISPISISLYNVLLLVFIDNGTQFDPSKIIDELKSKGLSPNRVTLQRLLHRYCQMGDMQQALKTLEEMKEDNMEINETVFASLFSGYGNIQDAESLPELMQLMRSSGVDPGNKAYTAYICAHINCDASDQAIKDILDEAIKEASLVPDDYIEILLALVKKRRDSPLVENVLHYIELSYRNAREYSSAFRTIFTLFQEGYHQTASSVFWDLKHTKTRLTTGRTGYQYVCAMIYAKNVPVDFIFKECQALLDTGLHSSPHKLLFPLASRNHRPDVIEKLLEVLKTTEEVKCHYYWPLLAQARDVNGLLNVLEHRIDPNLDQEELFDTFVAMVWPKMNAGSFEENFQTFSDLKFNKRMLFFSYLDSLKDDENLSTKLKSAIARVEKEVFDQKPFNMFLETVLITKLMRKLMPRDLQLATELYITIALHFGRAQDTLGLMVPLLKQKNQEELQRVIDATNQVKGENITLTELVIACLRGGHVAQAEKIIKSSPGRIYPARLEGCIQHFASRGWADKLRDLISSTKTLPGSLFDRDRAYHELLRLYKDQNMANETLELCTQMQEDGYQPNAATTKLAISILEKHDLKIPFTKLDS